MLVLGTLWLARGGLKSGYPLYTRFGWGQNLKQGQPVLLAGVTVGNVGDVSLRREGYLDVMLRIDDKYTIPKGSTAAVKAVGIFGDVAVALTPPMPVPAASYSPGDTVPPGPVSADIDLILSRTDSIARTTSVLLTALQQQMIAAGTLKDIHKLVADLAAASGELQGVVREQNGTSPRRWRRSATRRDASDERRRFGEASLRRSKTFAWPATTRRGSSRTSIRRTRELGKLLDAANNPNGTLGKLFSDSLLYSDSRHTIASHRFRAVRPQGESAEVHQSEHFRAEVGRTAEQRNDAKAYRGRARTPSGLTRRLRKKIE